MNRLDQWLSSIEFSLRTLGGNAHAARPVPEGKSATLSDADKALSGALMRVNHVGEVCAQALYQAQAMTAKTPQLRTQMAQSAREETDHLAWTKQRLDELGARPSLLNPLWYGGAFALGLLAGRLGDKASLAFVVETERQVEQHLLGHLERLPANDTASRAIVAQMAKDERAHADRAEQAGALSMPSPVRWAMKAAAKVMTTTAHHI
jgi:3-demethoxyubiquinol 3-hydroxylase